MSRLALLCFIKNAVQFLDHGRTLKNSAVIFIETINFRRSCLHVIIKHAAQQYTTVAQRSAYGFFAPEAKQKCKINTWRQGRRVEVF